MCRRCSNNNCILYSTYGLACLPYGWMSLLLQELTQTVLGLETTRHNQVFVGSKL